MRRWNHKVTKWTFDEITCWQIGKLMKCQVDEMASREMEMVILKTGILMKLKVDKIMRRWNYKVTKWMMNDITCWQNGKLIKCQVDAMIWHPFFPAWCLTLPEEQEGWVSIEKLWLPRLNQAQVVGSRSGCIHNWHLFCVCSETA